MFKLRILLAFILLSGGAAYCFWPAGNASKSLLVTCEPFLPKESQHLQAHLGLTTAAKITWSPPAGIKKYYSSCTVQFWNHGEPTHSRHGSSVLSLGEGQLTFSLRP